MKHITLDDHIKESLKDPAFKKEWDRTEPAYQLGRQMIKARIAKRMSQRKLAQLAKTTQAVISRIESMSVNPSIGILEKIASALGKKLEIKFV